MKKNLPLLLSALTFIIFSTPSLANENSFDELPDSTSGKRYPPKRTYVTTRTSKPPEIDGKLDDECWEGGGWDNFIFQREPVDGGTPTEKTIIKVVYDDNNIYAAARCYDSEPEKITRMLSGRDTFSGDLIGFCFDSYYDRRTSFEFGVNAAGIRLDNSVTNGNQINLNWNAVWEAKVGSEDSAWTAEFKIPLSQLYFSPKDKYTWGFMVWRWIFRKSEEDDWGPNPISTSTWVDRYGDITGIEGIKTPSRIEILPYTLGKYHTFQKEEGNPFKTGTDKSLDLGLDGKIGITSNFIIDFTINPDFGQVEADPSQISLSSYELQYEEKRPFFIEGSGILNFSPLYYPRRIGHVPSYYPSLGANEYVDMPDRTSILGAAKITGKTDGGLSIGVMESVTGKATADVQTPNGKYSTAVEPLTNFFMGRIQKEYNDGNIIIGGAFTAVNRNIGDDNLKFLPRASYTGGFDFIFKWDDKNYYISGNALASYFRGDKQSITQVQLSPVHYFQRPDADYLSLDTNKTSLAGYGGKLEFGKAGGNAWRFSESVTFYSPNFEVNDLGYLPQVDRVYQISRFGYVAQTPSGILRNYSAYFDQNSTWNFGGDNYSFEAGFFSNITFINRWYVNTNFYRILSALDPSSIWGGPLLKFPGGWRYSISAGSDNTKPLSLGLEFNNQIHDDNISKHYYISPSFTYRVTDALTFSGNVYYDFTRNNLQYVSTQSSGSRDIYFLGMVDQDLIGITVRASLYLTPDLSIQYYGSPFSATRKYSGFKKVINPRADNYNDRFYAYNQNQIAFDKFLDSYRIDENADGVTDFVISNPDMSFSEFRSNLVIRWEYNPGSTVYVVWSQNRSMLSAYESTSLSRAVDRVFSIYPDNIFMIKINHWFSL